MTFSIAIIFYASVAIVEVLYLQTSSHCVQAEANLDVPLKIRGSYIGELHVSCDLHVCHVTCMCVM